VGDADGGEVAAKKRSKRTVHERFRLGVKGRRCFVKDQDIGILDQSTSDGNTLLLSAGKLCTTGSHMRVEAIGLRMSVSRTQANTKTDILTKSLMN